MKVRGGKCGRGGAKEHGIRRHTRKNKRQSDLVTQRFEVQNPRTMSQPPHSQIPGSEVKKKGLPALAWVGIGCGGIVLIGIVCVVLAGVWGFRKVKEVAKELTSNPGKASAEFVVANHQDLEKVSENDETGEMTVRIKSSGEQLTLKYDDLAKGRIMVEDKDGKVTQLGLSDLQRVPAWIPRYPGAKDATSLMHSEDAGKISGMLTFTTTDTVEDVKKFYEYEARKLTFNSSGSRSMKLSGTETINLKFEAGTREMTVDIYGMSGQPLGVKVLYVEKK